MKSSLNYERIPENDSNLDEKPQFFSKTYRKLIAGFFILFILGGVIFSFIMSYIQKQPEEDFISIYQTSKLYNDHLSELTLSQLQERGFNIEGIEFYDTTSFDSSSFNYGETSKGTIYIDSDITYQSIIGFGGAFTESSAYIFFKLPVKIRDKFLDAYFGENGIGYTVGRIHINSCDFSLNSYSFDDVPDDYNLLNFDHDVTHDTHQIIPFILAAMKKSKQPINLLASPWSPPSWMKVPVKEGNITTSKMTGSNTPNGLRSDPKIMSAWARYISLFIDAYENHGVPIWAVTPQNEPEFAAPWEACAYNASFESLFVEKYLGPILKSDHPEIKILAFDHNKDHLYSWAKTMLFPTSQSNQLSQYVDGMAFHWYGGTGDRLLDGTYGYDTVNQTYHLAPNKILMATEGCSCPGVEINNWVRAERLGHDLIFDLNNYAQGWIDWNLIVDYQGGPNHLNNLCDAPIFAREDFSHYHLQPKYYYMGHVSKFVVPGSKRIKVSVVGKFSYQKIHPEVHSGVELGIYYCEQSAKQMWTWVPSHDNTTTGYIKLMMSVLPEGSSDSTNSNTNGATNSIELQFCMSKGDENRNYLRAWECPPVAPDKDDERVKRHLKLRMFPLKTSDNGSFKHFLLIQDDSISTSKSSSSSTSSSSTTTTTTTTNSNSNTTRTSNNNNNLPYCISSSNGTPHYGALLELRPCSTHDITQHWSLDTHTGELKNPDSGLCVTAGWPYLTATGFKTPDDKTVIVVMNEAPTDSYLTINDSKRGTLVSAINGHSIETIIYHSDKR